MADQKFDISIDRVDKIPVPLLVVGLGGTGCDVLKTIKTTFAERYNLPKTARGQEKPAPIKTAYLGFDSLAIRPEGLEVNEYVDISLPGMDKILSNQDTLLHPHERAWVNRNLKHSAVGMGMGTIRQAARLALERNYSKVYTALVGALKEVVSEVAGNANGPANQIEITVVTGIGGGTGSGTFLDIAQIIRRAANEVSTIPAKITGYVIMPDVSLANVSAAGGMAGPIKHNAYAALKELDFWMRVKKHGTRYTMTYGDGVEIEWKNPPFDNCILMSSSNVGGTPYKDGYMAVRSTIAENLMHYMAKEDGADTQYSYRQYEDNLAAIKTPKSYPLNYGYRAIGAFTKRIPKKPLLYYEGALLLKTFFPMRDDNDVMQPDRRMFTDGQGKFRAEAITGNGKQLLQDFKTSVCRLPNFCSLDLNDKVKVTAVQNQNPPPHNVWHKWRDQVCAPSAMTEAEKYLAQGWARFMKFAEGVMTDPAQGPFALEKYLDAEDGLLADMTEVLTGWKNQHHKVRTQQIGQAEQMCTTAWPGFHNPPMLGRAKALEQYDHAIKTLYTYVLNSEFLEKHVEALEKLVLRIKEYLRDGLKPLCAALLMLEGEFNKPEDNDDTLVQDIYKLTDVQEKIDSTFEVANENNVMTCSFLQSVMDISMATAPSVDAKTSGVTFLCRGAGAVALCELVQKKLEEAYGDVNQQSLDAVMIANVGEDVSAQQQWMDSLAKGALNSALPMFMQDSVFSHEAKAPYSYMSIPKDAVLHLKYISEAFKTHSPAVEPKASTLTDHIYCLNAWDKLPLYRYGMMEDLRMQYDMDLKVTGAEGVHLVRNGDPDADYTTDWSMLPSPKPYFLFGRNGVNCERVEYEKVHSLVERALACGMLVVNDDKPFVSATLRRIYAGNGQALMSKESLMTRRNEIAAQKNPATGDVYSAKQIGEKLAAFLETADVVRLEENEVSPANVAHVMGLENEPCDPFAPGVQGDEIRLAQAKANHKKLCVVMVEAMIYTYPDLVRAMETQIDAYEAIAAEIAASAQSEVIWERRMDYADTLADIFVHLNAIISLGGSGYKYKIKGEKYDIVTPALLADDVKKSESMLLQAFCFLADVPADNVAKADLTGKLKTAIADYNSAVDDETITKDDMDDLMEAAKDLISEIEADTDALKHELRENPGQAEALKSQIAMMEAVSKAVSAKNTRFRRIAKGLD